MQKPCDTPRQCFIQCFCTKHCVDKYKCLSYFRNNIRPKTLTLFNARKIGLFFNDVLPKIILRIHVMFITCSAGYHAGVTIHSHTMAHCQNIVETSEEQRKTTQQVRKMSQQCCSRGHAECPSNFSTMFHR